MNEKLIESAEDSVAIIRNKVKEDVVKSDFRRKLIGGISEDDVEDYINMIQLQFQYKENKLNEQIEELISLKDKLRIEFNTYIEKAEQEKKKLLEDLENTKKSLEEQTMQCNENEALISDLKEYKAMYEQEKSSNEALSKDVEILKKKLQEEMLRSSAKDEAVGMLTRSLGRPGESSQPISKPKNFDLELDSLYKELEKVKSQVEMNNDLQRQLELEKQRSEKVEKEMGDFFKRMLELKDKIEKSSEN